MGFILDSQKKFMNLLDWILPFLFMTWIYISLPRWHPFTLFIIISVAILLIVIGALKIIKPLQFPRAKMQYSPPVTERFFIWSQRVSGILIITIITIILIYIYPNYPYGKRFEMLEFGILVLAVFVAIALKNIIWLIYFSKRNTWASKIFVGLSLASSLLFCVAGIRYIIFSLDNQSFPIISGSVYYVPASAIFQLFVIWLFISVISSLFNYIHIKERAGEKIIRIRSLMIIIFIIAVPLVLWMIIGNIYASRMERETDQLWERNFYSPSYMKMQFAPTTKNQIAEKIEQFTEELGFPLRYKPFDINEINQKTVLDDARKDLFNYLYQELHRTDNIVGKPPGQLQKYFSRYSAKVEALCHFIVQNEPPTWNKQPYDYTWIDRGGMFYMHKVFIAYALERINSGKQQEALECMEASWKMDGHDIELISGILRKIGNVPTQWYDRMNSSIHEKRSLLHLEHNVYGYLDFKRKFKYGNYIWSNYAIEVISQKITSALWYPLGPIVRPYYRMCVADFSTKVIMAITEYRKQDKCLFHEFNDYGQEEKYYNSSWNKMNYLFPQFGYDDTFQGISQLIIHTEFTQKIIQIKQLKSSSPDHSWPAVIPGIESSQCKSLRWIYSVKTDDTMCISANKMPKANIDHWGETVGLPIQYCEKSH